MHKAADLYPGRAKTDRRDVFIIAETARTMPHTLRAVDRLRSILTQIYPSLERVFTGSSLPTRLFLIYYKGPQGLKRAEYHRVLSWMINHTRKDLTILFNKIFEALTTRTVTVIGSDAAELVIPQLAANIKALKEQQDTSAEQVENMLDDFPLSWILDRACPGQLS